jgi:predicted flap endonuclease-1-like 5' DNA nuclease
MLHYLIELAVWLLGSYFAGACLGCILRKFLGADVAVEAPAIAAAVAVPAAAVAASIPRYTPPPAPVVTPPVATLPKLAVPAVEPVRMARMERPRGITMARNGKADDLLRISGVGPKNEKILHSLGFFHFDQIASWTPEQVSWVDDHLRFGGRIDREEWINQAKLLANGNEAEFTRLYGSGGEGSKESGLRTVRGPNEKAESAAPVATLVQTFDKAADDKAAASGKMNKPKGLTKARGGKPDDLKRISGIGPKNESILHSLGFYHFDQIAAWTATEVNWVDDHLRFGGRIKREEWIRQAELLATGKDAEFAKLYGTGGLRNKKGETLSGSRTRKS